MACQPHPQTVVDDIERLIQVDVGRHITALFEAARGGLRSAASALTAAEWEEFRRWVAARQTPPPPPSEAITR